MGRPRIRADGSPEFLPGTVKLELTRPLDEVMVDGINRFALRELEESPNNREKYWHRDFGSYESSVEPNRQHLRTILGVVDERTAGTGFELVETTATGSELAHTENYTVRAVRWQALPGVTAEGLLLDPRQPPRARAIVLPDADWTPEAFAGLTTGVDSHSQLPRRLAENGVQVVVPTLISRDDAFSGNPDIRFTNQPHREFIYRMAFELGRHVIGYEIEKTLAAVDIFSQMNSNEGHNVPIGVAGVGEGGLVAFYAAAVDRRDSGGAGQRILPASRKSVAGTDLSKRLVTFTRIRRRGDRLAHCAARPGDRGGFRSERERPPRAARWPYGCGPGRIETADLKDVQREFARLKQLLPATSLKQITLVEKRHGRAPGSDAAVAHFLECFDTTRPLKRTGESAAAGSPFGGSDARQKRQLAPTRSTSHSDFSKRVPTVRDENGQRSIARIPTRSPSRSKRTVTSSGGL